MHVFQELAGPDEDQKRADVADVGDHGRETVVGCVVTSEITKCGLGLILLRKLPFASRFKTLDVKVALLFNCMREIKTEQETFTSNVHFQIQSSRRLV